MHEQLKIGSRILTLAMAIGLWMLSAPPELSAQWSIEGRAGAAIPMGELTDDPGLNQTAGISLAGAAMYTFENNLSLYGEGSWQQFNCDGCDTDVESWGFDGGLKYVLAESGTAYPWVRAGATLQKASAGGEGEWGVGLDSGVGIDWLVTPSLALVPAVRFDIYEADELTVSYLTIDLGAHWHLY